jgi:hypothetical protein
MENYTEEELEELEKMRGAYREMYRTHVPSQKLGHSFEDYLMISLTLLRDAYVKLREQMEE